jgi:hypothetical protein
LAARFRLEINSPKHPRRTDKGILEAIMQFVSDSKEAQGFSFQVDLLNLNLHLAESEKSPEPQTEAHEEALAQMRRLVYG